MRQWTLRSFASLLLLACAGGLVFIFRPRSVLAWAIGYLVTLASCAVLEWKLSRLERRSFHLRPAQLALMPVLWPLYLADCLLRSYALWSQPRRDAKYERQRRERFDRMTSTDAAMTDRRCPFCTKPCPSYRKTCKHCRRRISDIDDGRPAMR